MLSIFAAERGTSQASFGSEDAGININTININFISDTLLMLPYI